MNLNLVEEGVAGEDEGMLLMVWPWRLPGFGKGQVWGDEHVAGRSVDFRRRHRGRVRRSAEELQYERKDFKGRKVCG